MLKIILAILVVAVCGFLVIAAMKPDEFSVTRGILIDAPASTVFANVNNLQKWGAWSPWAEMEPDAVTTFSGPAQGVGAAMHWTGKKLGEGSMTVLESNPNKSIKFQLDFIKPMASTSTAEFTFAEKNGQTAVTWDMKGHNNFIAKMISVVMDCEKMVGEQYDKGLANLKAVAETGR